VFLAQRGGIAAQANERLAKVVNREIVKFGRDPRCNRWPSEGRRDILVHGGFAAIGARRRCG
jgi:hypothetical protein